MPARNSEEPFLPLQTAGMAHGARSDAVLWRLCRRGFPGFFSWQPDAVSRESSSGERSEWLAASKEAFFQGRTHDLVRLQTLAFLPACGNRGVADPSARCAWVYNASDCVAAGGWRHGTGGLRKEPCGQLHLQRQCDISHLSYHAPGHVPAAYRADGQALCRLPQRLRVQSGPSRPAVPGSCDPGFCGCLGWALCAVLLRRYSGEHGGNRAAVPSGRARCGRARRIHPGELPQLGSDSGYCLHPECLWKLFDQHGGAHDLGERSALQRGCRSGAYAHGARRWLVWPYGGRAGAQGALRRCDQPHHPGNRCRFAWSLLGLPMPKILASTVGNVAVLATPLGLMALGAEFRFRLRAGAWAPLPWQAS